MNLFKKYLVLPLLIALPLLVQCQDVSKLKEGDIIFQTSNSGQSKAIQLATNSKFSHCGVLIMDRGELKVVEAVQPVKITSLSSWIKRGDNSYYEVKRLKNDSVINTAAIANLKKEYQKLLGTNYDIYFGWSDKEIYCSELVWKLYKRAFAVEVCQLHELREYNLEHPTVKKILQQRYGNNIPMTEKMVSPADIYNSTLLQRVK